MDLLLRGIDNLNKVIKILVSIFIAIMAIVMILQVFSRFIFDLPLNWSEELARYLSIYAVFFGAAIALRYQQLIAVEALVDRVPETPRKILRIIVLVICIVFFALLFVKGIDMVERVNTQKSPAMQIPMSIPYAAVPIGAVLLIMNSLAVIIENVKGENK
ncbi:TRAP transporter small permease [Bacillus sp. FJAT-50079]|uniref:TRAP transporter small permease n=1 Tax=Bacillus sp. FJAT-50079 TaxID=2833577 RepID=UPI001BC8DBD3|nr:TRAP transporter small permease [Bacillus sp. FJAT-50079]